MKKPSWQEIAELSGRRFIKMQGLGNHFVIVDSREERYQPSPEESARICDVRRGVGADQLLIIEPPSTTGRRAGASAFMRIINVDGVESEACGNATRCVAWLLLQEDDSDTVAIETLAGVLQCQRSGDRSVAVHMGKISSNWQDIPLVKNVDTLHIPLKSGLLRDGVALNIGNPHIVFFVDRLDQIDVAELAHPIQRNPLFPQLINVDVAQLMDDNHIKLSVYERPGLLTAACGSGACVTAYAAKLRGLTQESLFIVEMEAGEVTIELGDDDTAIMTGPVEFCFGGILR